MEIFASFGALLLIGIVAIFVISLIFNFLEYIGPIIFWLFVLACIGAGVMYFL